MNSTLKAITLGKMKADSIVNDIALKPVKSLHSKEWVLPVYIKLFVHKMLGFTKLEYTIGTFTKENLLLKVELISFN